MQEDVFYSPEQLISWGEGGGMWMKPSFQRKTKIVCTIGPSTASREMIWKLADAGMNVARLNMSHGDHNSHKKVIDLVKEYNEQSAENVIAIMLDTKVKLPQACAWALGFITCCCYLPSLYALFLTAFLLNLILVLTSGS
jgi:hypothetical protein